MYRVFLLSPAKSSGKRAQLLVRPQASFDLACRVRAGTATLGEVFVFCSGLYFRGKLAYARRFAQPPAGFEGVHVITPSRGLVSHDFRVGLADLQEFSSVAVEDGEGPFTAALRQSVLSLATRASCDVVLLGSIASRRYVETLLPLFGQRLLFPREFVGRGDMSRGGLLLRRTITGEELEYIPVAGAIRHGTRPPRLERVHRARPRVGTRWEAEPSTRG
jgi:hypothetical protein